MIDYLKEIKETLLPFPPVEMPMPKRIFDIAVTTILLILSIPFMLLALLGHALESLIFPASRGPLIYSELRISKSLPFQIYKFRIFKTTATQNYRKAHGFIQTKALEQNPHNLTVMGKILKQIYMDELPQLLNVLKGEMTLVGPRPSNEVVTWEDGKQGKFQRYLFTCGITGAFQAVKDASLPKDQNKMDMDYIVFCKNNSGWKIVLKDIKILFQTLLTILRARGV